MNQVRSFEAQAMPLLENLYRTALYLSNTKSDARALVEKSMIRSYRSWLIEKTKPNCRIWLFRNMADAFLSKYQPSSRQSNTTSIGGRTNGHQVHSPSVNCPPGNLPVKDSLAAISGSDVENAIINLPGDYRLIVVLSLLEDFSYRDIGEIAGLRLEAVRFKLHEGRRLMSESFFQQVARQDSRRKLQAESGGKVKVSDQCF